MLVEASCLYVYRAGYRCAVMKMLSFHVISDVHVLFDITLLPRICPCLCVCVYSEGIEHRSSVSLDYLMGNESFGFSLRKCCASVSLQQNTNAST